jgi:hypothetical protein
MNPRSIACFAASLLSVALLSALSAEQPEKKSASSTVAYFAGGCFWCTEEIFKQQPGIKSVVSGYMSGAETIEVRFDPAKTLAPKLKKLGLKLP